jgi:geranylgeranyl reductase family protein
VRRDVIVVGAGPAGSAAACDLAAGGRDVLLLDRLSFPRDKACGDGFTPRAIAILNELGLEAEIRAAEFYPINGIRIGTPGGRTWETSFLAKREGAAFYIAPRFRLDVMVQRRAVELGAEFVQADVKSFLRRDGRIGGVVMRATDGAETPVESRIVIGADGATSAVARALRDGGRRPLEQRAVAVRAYLDGIETLPHRVEFYFHRRFLPGYGWIFPLGERSANVGVIVRAELITKRGLALTALLAEFLETPPVRARLAAGHQVRDVKSWQLALGGCGSIRRAWDGALLVGDAAGLVDPLTGEGIQNALISARIAAEVASEALRRDDASHTVLAEYERRCERIIDPSLCRSHRVERWVANSPWRVNSLFAIANRAPKCFDWLLNRLSNDFVVGAGEGDSGPWGKHGVL